jgi:hypothetical protein
LCREGVPRRRRHEFLLYARIRAAMVVRRRRVTAVMVEATIMRGHIEARCFSVNAGSVNIAFSTFPLIPAKAGIQRHAAALRQAGFPPSAFAL